MAVEEECVVGLEHGGMKQMIRPAGRNNLIELGTVFVVLDQNLEVETLVTTRVSCHVSL
jgi:hypothetical protein